MHYSAMFDEKNVILYHNKPAFDKINPNALINFLPCIYDWRKDQAVLDTWKEHFESQGIPFAITRHKGERTREKTGKHQKQSYTFALWKEQRI